MHVEFRAYLAVIARNMAIDHLRKYKKEELTDEAETLSEETVTPEDEVMVAMSVNEALDKLKPIYRQIVSLKVLGELTFKEISKIMDMPMGTVTWNYQEAIKQLRRCGYE